MAGALLRNLDKVISEETKMPVLVAEDPLDCVAIGTGKALDNIDLFQNCCSIILQNKKSVKLRGCERATVFS